MVFITTPFCLRTKHLSLDFSNQLFKVKFIKEKSSDKCGISLLSVWNGLFHAQKK